MVSSLKSMTLLPVRDSFIRPFVRVPVAKSYRAHVLGAPVGIMIFEKIDLWCYSFLRISAVEVADYF